jgi:hypothetical protein
MNRIGGVMVSVLTSSAVGRDFEPCSCQILWYLSFLRKARNTKEQEQRLVGAEAG